MRGGCIGWRGPCCLSVVAAIAQSLAQGLLLPISLKIHLFLLSLCYVFHDVHPSRWKRCCSMGGKSPSSAHVQQGKFTSRVCPQAMSGTWHFFILFFFEAE